MGKDQKKKMSWKEKKNKELNRWSLKKQNEIINRRNSKDLKIYLKTSDKMCLQLNKNHYKQLKVLKLLILDMIMKLISKKDKKILHQNQKY